MERELGKLHVKALIRFEDNAGMYFLLLFDEEETEMHGSFDEVENVIVYKITKFLSIVI
jgi:hypothetical protein